MLFWHSLMWCDGSVEHEWARLSLSGFCHFGLVLFMVLWQSPDTPVMSCFHVSARLRVCSSGVQIPALMSRVRSATHTSVHVCWFVLLHTVRVFSLCFSLAACFYVVMSCVNTWLMGILISCVFVSCFAHGWWFVLLAMCLCICFVWAHGFCLSFLRAMCSHVNCLDPTHLVTLLLVNLPHLSFLGTLFICSLYNILVFVSSVPVCHRFTLDVSCPALSCLAKPLPCFCFFPNAIPKRDVKTEVHIKPSCLCTVTPLVPHNNTNLYNN